MFFAWRDEYNINIKEIDNQHKKFFEIGRKTSDLIFSNDRMCSDDEIVMIVDELKSYANYHFKFEEKLMKETGYPYYETHKNDHEMMIRRVREIENSVSGTVNRETLMVLINFIFDWITHHILKSDIKYKEYVK